MQKTIFRLIIFTAAGLLLGMFFGRTTIFSILLLTAVTGLSCFIFVIINFVGSINDKKSKKTAIFGFISLSLIVTLVTSILTMRKIADNKQKLAEDFIPKIEKYKQNNSKYPKTLSAITEIKGSDAEKLVYWTDTSQQQFVLKFFEDGWHFTMWDSERKKWISGD
jgi:ABC-type transport system involved in multi-copper enzyme maturation permease subunit